MVGGGKSDRLIFFYSLTVRISSLRLTISKRKTHTNPHFLHFIGDKRFKKIAGSVDKNYISDVNQLSGIIIFLFFRLILMRNSIIGR